MSDNWRARLIAVGAPPELVQWAESAGTRTHAIASCQRPDWLVWMGRAEATSPDAEAKVLRAAAGVVALERTGARWLRLLFRLRSDALDEIASFSGYAVLRDTDHQLADFVSGGAIALLIWAPLDIYLFLRPLGALSGVRREIITLPVLALVTYAATRLWTRLRLRAAAATVRTFATLWARISREMKPSERVARREAQLLAARRALGFEIGPGSS